MLGHIPPLLSQVGYIRGVWFFLSLPLLLLRLLSLLRGGGGICSWVELGICNVEKPTDAGGQTDPELLQAAHVYSFSLQRLS
jgi:hypothetical protein